MTYGNELYSRTVFTERGPSTIYFKAPEPLDTEPETEQTFTRRQKRLYEQATGQQRTETAAKPRTKKKKLGEAQQARSKARSSRIASKGIRKRML